jgi:hypothetical protein
MALLRSKGKVTLLRVHDVGSKFGPPRDEIDAEVVFQISTKPDNFFGFQLRDDRQRAARQGMLDLLRDAFNHGWDLEVVYDLKDGKKNAIAMRVWVVRSASGPGPGKVRGIGKVALDTDIQ